VDLRNNHNLFNLQRVYNCIKKLYYSTLFSASVSVSTLIDGTAADSPSPTTALASEGTFVSSVATVSPVVTADSVVASVSVVVSVDTESAATSVVLDSSTDTASSLDDSGSSGLTGVCASSVTVDSVTDVYTDPSTAASEVSSTFSTVVTAGTSVGSSAEASSVGVA